MLRNMAPAGQNVASLLDPPPQQFLRAPRTDMPYGPFAPAALTSLDAKLDKGFPPLAPPTMSAPHPFATHDVVEDDWQRFLNDVKVASTLSTIDKVKMGVAPMAMGVAPLTGGLLTFYEDGLSVLSYTARQGCSSRRASRRGCGPRRATRSQN